MRAVKPSGGGVGRRAIAAMSLLVLSTGLVVTGATAAHADTLPMLTVEHLERDTNGALVFDTVIDATGFDAPGEPCANDAWCDGSVEVKYAADGSVGAIAGGLDFSPNHATSQEAAGTIPSLEISDMRAEITGPYQSVYGAWIPVVDPYPSPEVSATAHTIERDANGSLVYDVTIDAQYLGLPDAVCGNTASWCTGGVEAEYADNSPPGSLVGGADFSGTAPISHQFQSTVVSKQIVAIRGFVQSAYKDFAGPWVPVNDPFPTPTIDVSPASFTRDDDGNLHWDVTTNTADLAVPGGICYQQNWCTMTVQVRHSLDQSIGNLSVNYDVTGAAPVSRSLQGTDVTPTIDAIRAEVFNAYTQTYGPWHSVTDAQPMGQVGVNVSEYLRTPDGTANGSLAYDITLDGKYLETVGSVCNGMNWCTAGIEVRSATNQSVTQLDGGVDFLSADPISHEFTGTSSVGATDAVRGFVQNYLGTQYGEWLPVSEDVHGGHDLAAAAGILIGFATPSEVSGAALCEQLFPIGTNGLLSSTNDQLNACAAALTLGTLSLTAIVIKVLSDAGPNYVTSDLAFVGAQYQLSSTSPLSGDMPSAGCTLVSLDEQTCPQENGPPIKQRAKDAPPEYDPVYENNQLNKIWTALPIGDPTESQKENLTEQWRKCVEYVNAMDTINDVTWASHASVGADECSSKPIFFTGSTTGQATQHDLNAITGNGTDEMGFALGQPMPSLLHYAKTSEKPPVGLSSTLVANCRKQVTDGDSLDCDEYPFRSTDEGRPDGSSTAGDKLIAFAPIPGLGDNRLQGTYLRNFYAGCSILQNSTRGSSKREYFVVPVPTLPTFSYCPAPKG